MRKLTLCFLGLSAMVVCAAFGDLIHLKNGKTLNVKEVLYKKDGQLFYKNKGESVIGIPLSIVENWERVSEPAPSREKIKKAKSQKVEKGKPVSPPKKSSIREEAPGRKEFPVREKPPAGNGQAA